MVPYISDIDVVLFSETIRAGFIQPYVTCVGVRPLSPTYD